MNSTHLDRRGFMKSLGLAAAVAVVPGMARAAGPKRPNIVLIYADDLGYGDVGCYGGQVATPNIDGLARRGLRFTNAHAPSATCTPSRYAMLTGEYAWRQKGTGVLPGDAALIVKPGRTTLASILQKAGYTTGVVGKWHLGLGDGALDWNDQIKPGPLEIGFDSSFLIPATGDRVPCVYVENHRVAGLDPADPIQVRFGQKIGDEPTGRENPELLKLHPSHGHDQTIVNGISRIGYMTGGQAARWIDEDMADVITARAEAFIEQNQAKSFFLYFATHDIHVPRVPHGRFVGKSGMGARGDAILQFDWSVGQIVKKLDQLGLSDNTLILLTSDNGPVVDDGYKDQAVELLGDHKPAGPLRGGKYSIFNGGTRVPFVTCWPGAITPGESGALVCQVDFPASMAAWTGQTLAQGDAPDSYDVMDALLGKSPQGRDHLVQHAGTLALIEGDWKYIGSSQGARISQPTNTELGNDPKSQLYNLKTDLAERTNLASQYPDRVKAMAARLETIRTAGRSRP